MPAPTAQRLADSLEFLNQVMRGLSGEESGMAHRRVTGADAEQRLKTVVQRNQQYTNSVRKAIGAAEALSKAQAAARASAGAGQRACRRSWQARPPRVEAGGAYKIWCWRFWRWRRCCWARWFGSIRKTARSAAQQRAAGARE